MAHEKEQFKIIVAETLRRWTELTSPREKADKIWEAVAQSDLVVMTLSDLDILIDPLEESARSFEEIAIKMHEMGAKIRKMCGK